MIRARAWVCCLLAAGLCADAARAADPYTGRRRRRARPGTPAPAARPRNLLAPGRWRPEVAAALESVLAANGIGTPGYDPGDPPKAVVVLDDVALTHSPGELMFYRLVERAEFSFSETLWGLVPERCGRARIRAGWQGFREQPRAAWARDPYYNLYRKGLIRCRAELCRDFGGQRCSGWVVKLLAGFPESDARRYARQTVIEELRRPVGVDAVAEAEGDPAPARAERGLRFIPEMRELFARLKERGIDTWILSRSNHWAAQAAAAEYGVHESRVLGIRPKVVEGAATPELLIPMFRGTGNAEGVAIFVGGSPALIIGGEEDEALMRYGRGTRIQLVEGDAAAVLEKRRWLLQPRFSPVLEPQAAAALVPR